ncbi:MAG TPA: IS21-like element helper ATPase IstB [Planctomycetota bacterium]
MSQNKDPKKLHDELRQQLAYLKLPFVEQHLDELAKQAASAQWSHVEFLSRLIDGEAHERQERARQRRISQAHFPVVKLLDQFDFTWPSKLNRAQVQDLFRLKFIDDKANVIFVGGVGLGKSHLSIALGHAACQAGHRVLFATAIDIVNTLSAAQNAGRLAAELKKYLRPSVLLMDELGYLPIDKRGADLLFQVISQRYERGSIVLTTNKAYKHWPSIFNNDSTLTSAILDRVLHHAETIVIDGKSYRMKDRIDP